jgi:hypothetical protein
MDTLFDISPDEPVRSKGKRLTRAQPAATAEEPESPVLLRAFQTVRVLPPLGRIDHTYECADERCGAQCHDILHEDSGEWRVECAFCGTGQWVEVIPGHLKPKDREFLLRDGRFAGLSLDEVERQPRGLDYLAWALTGHPRQIVRDAVKKHMEGKA